MINYNGNLTETNTFLTTLNRAYRYGDSVFEIIRCQNNNVLFLEDHYFRLMASMRMLRMKIGLHFTMVFFEDQIIKTLEANGLINVRVRFTVFRKDGGLYTPLSHETEFVVEASTIAGTYKEEYQIDLFKDHYIHAGLLSTIKTNNRILNVLAAIYADENGIDNCILLNERKNVVEAINANIFILTGNVVKTPALSEGCIKGIIRKKLIEMLKKDPTFELIEGELSVFELQKADEIFLTNSIIGIQPVSKYRKTSYRTETGLKIKNRLEALYMD